MMHLPTLAERPDLFRIAGLAEIDRAALDAVGERYGVAVRTTDYRQLIRRGDVDAVLLATSGSHKEAAIAALQADKHVFVEKPVGFSLAETESVSRAARRSRSVLMVGYHKRFDPSYRRARAEVRTMRDLRFVQVTVLHPDDGAYRTHHALVPPRPWAEPAEQASDEAGVAEVTTGAIAAAIEETVGPRAAVTSRVAASMLFLSLIHDVNAVRGVLGEPEEVLSAHVWRGGFAQSSLTRFAGNVRVAMTWVSLPGLKHYEERLLFVSPEKRVTLVFPSPYLRHFPTPLLIERMEGGELVAEERTVSYEEAFRAELLHFHECVTQRKKPETSIEDALGDARWIQAIVQAFAPGARAPRPLPAPRARPAPPARRKRLPAAARRRRRRRGG
jgi:predicted dehydrogenase